MRNETDQERRDYFLAKAKACDDKFREAEQANRWWTAPVWRGARDSYLFMARIS